MRCIGIPGSNCKYFSSLCNTIYPHRLIHLVNQLGWGYEIIKKLLINNGQLNSCLCKIFIRWCVLHFLQNINFDLWALLAEWSGESSCSWWVAGLNPNSIPQSCPWAKHFTHLAYWWWSDGTVASVYSSPTSVSVPQGRCSYIVACHRQSVLMGKWLWCEAICSLLGLDWVLYSFRAFTIFYQILLFVDFFLHILWWCICISACEQIRFWNDQAQSCTYNFQTLEDMHVHPWGNPQASWDTLHWWSTWYKTKNKLIYKTRLHYSTFQLRQTKTRNFQ